MRRRTEGAGERVGELEQGGQISDAAAVAAHGQQRVLAAAGAEVGENRFREHYWIKAFSTGPLEIAQLQHSQIFRRVISN